jgi:hypothetical protein
VEKSFFPKEQSSYENDQTSFFYSGGFPHHFLYTGNILGG